MAAAHPLDFALLMAPVAGRLLGEPNKGMSRAPRLRFGAKGSMEIDTKEGWFSDHEANVSGGVLELIQHKHGCDKRGALTWLEDEGLKDCGERTRAAPSASPAFYDYADTEGAVGYRVERRGKGHVPPFLQHGPDGRGGFHARRGCMQGVSRLPYRLPELIAADPALPVFIVEGEKDADRLAGLGLIATTNSEGAGKFRAELAPHFAGRRVVIIPDNDKPGRDHAADVAAKLAGVAVAIVTLELPSLPDKGDVSDWLASQGHGADAALRLVELAEAALATPRSLPRIGGGPDAAPVGRKGARRDDPSEDDIALAFTAQHRDTLRFDHDLGLWLEWDGARWRQNNSHRAFTYARELARRHAAPGKANFAAGVERFARADRAHAVNADIWDADPMLLGTPGGTVDLRTGDFAAARPDDYITKLTGCTPEHGEPTRWLAFLNEALGGDQDAIRFLKLWAGYCLTGDTREHALIFLHGLAGTGKSVFLNTLAALLGDYAVTAAMETFTASKFDRHSTELAMLRGARLVTASETEEGRAWAEARIKQITGGDPITARFMRQDNFTFRPQFKLTIVGNHAPRLTNPDDAMRRRFNIIGFNIKPAAPDLELETKLRAEHGRILAWAIAGCREWQARGLIRPAAVTAATTEYFAGEDLMGQWLEERCTLRPGAFELPAKLYGDWRRYAEDHGEAPARPLGSARR